MSYAKLIEFFIKPKKIIIVINRIYQNWIKTKLWKLFDKNLKINSNIKFENGKELILIEGFWDNPNNFFRIKLLLESICNKNNKEIVGILRKKMTVQKIL